MKKNLKLLLGNSKYFDKILECYHLDLENDLHRNELQSIENDMIQFLYDDFVDCDGFFEHAMNEYLKVSSFDNAVDGLVVAFHKQFTDIYPKYIYCIELFVYYHRKYFICN